MALVRSNSSDLLIDVGYIICMDGRHRKNLKTIIIIMIIFIAKLALTCDVSGLFLVNALITIDIFI